jgi:hypothetical protein
VDFCWHGPRHEGYPLEMASPEGRVFVVLVRRIKKGECGCVGEIGKWNWVKEDPRQQHTPVNWGQRYSKRIWNR